MVEVDVGDDVAWKVMKEAVVENLFVCLERVEKNEDLSDMVGNVITFTRVAHDHTLLAEKTVGLEDRIAREVELLANQAYRREALASVEFALRNGVLYGLC